MLWVGWFLFVWGFLFGWFDFWFCLVGFFSIEENNGLIFEKNPAWLLLISGKVVLGSKDALRSCFIYSSVFVTDVYWS